MQTWLTLRSHPWATTAVAVGLICVIGPLDFVLPHGIPLLLAYLLPIALIGTVSSRVGILLAASVCTAVSEATDAYVWNVREGIARDLVTLIAFAAVGLYVREFVTKQETERLHVQALSDENAARIEAEEQLTLLIGNSALSILTMSDDGSVLQANIAAQRMFSGKDEDTQIVGLKIDTLLPSLGRVMARSAEGRNMRTMMQAQGVRFDGEPFLSEVWFSNYSTSLGRRTAAMVVDISEEFRNREESVTEQLLNNSRLAVGAMAHEMRNVVGAIQLVMQSLASDSPVFVQSTNMVAMRELVSTLETMASSQLSYVKRNAAQISLNQFLSELYVVARAILSEYDIELLWDVPQNHPSVWADTEGLMQVFLNLLRNSRSALLHTTNARVRIQSRVVEDRVEITCSDNGPGVAESRKTLSPIPIVTTRDRSRAISVTGHSKQLPRRTTLRSERRRGRIRCGT